MWLFLVDPKHGSSEMLVGVYPQPEDLHTLPQHDHKEEDSPPVLKGHGPLLSPWPCQKQLRGPVMEACEPAIQLFRVRASSYRVSGLGLRVYCGGLKVQGSGFRVQGLGQCAPDIFLCSARTFSRLNPEP